MAVAVAEIVPAEPVTVAVVKPAGIINEPGNPRSRELLDSTIVAPPTGAAPDSVAVHVVVWFVLRLVGAHARLAKIGDGDVVKVMVAVLIELL